MKKRTFITCFAIALCVLSGTAFAFGGGGGGRTQRYYARHKKGVDALGAHMHTDGRTGEFCLYDLSNDPNAEEIQPGVFHCKGGSILNCSTGVCTACPAGTYAAAEDESCTTTPAGNYTPEGAAEPIPCPVGTYNAIEGAAECTPADPGYYTNATGATDVLECEPGYYCPGGTDHMQAEAGHYVPSAGASEQTAAEPGYYVDTTGATSQKPCPEGTYTSDTGATSCQDPDPGYQPAQPTPNAEVPCSDTTTLGACGCPADKYADGQGNCYAGQCANVWINECTLSCTQADGPQTLADGTACQNNLGTCQNGFCCGENNRTCTTEQEPELYCRWASSDGQSCDDVRLCATDRHTGTSVIGTPNAQGNCASEGEELYCDHTNDQGQCIAWEICQEGHSTTNRIVGIPDATGACADFGEGGYEVYCTYTDDNGQCIYWEACAEGMSSRDSIVGVPNAYGTCGNDDYPELYCDGTNDNGQCTRWGYCAEGMSTQDGIVNISNAYGACADEGYEVYCYLTNNSGQCTEWSNCEEGKSSRDSIVGVPSANGACADIEQYPELYCSSTNDQGECTGWGVCMEGKSTQNSIVNIPNASGACADEGYEVYCKNTNGDGDCGDWGTCEEGMSSRDLIVGVPYAYGACGHDNYPEVYCYATNDNGQCTSWGSCMEGKSTKDLIVGRSNAQGVCTDEGYEVYCTATDTNGDCMSWSYCTEGQNILGSIVGKPNATGICGCPSDGDYPPEPNGNNQCVSHGYGFNPENTSTNNGYNLVDIDAYGCPYNLSNNADPTQKVVSGKTICCSGNLQFDTSNYTWTQSNNGWENDGYKKYNIACGCPSDAYTSTPEMRQDGSNTSICCNGSGYEYDDSESYSYTRNNYSKYNPYCGCPSGTQSTTSANGPICCWTDIAMRGLDYTGQIQSACFTVVGCPSGYTAEPGGPDGTICCNDDNSGYDYFTQYYDVCKKGCSSGTFSDYNGNCQSCWTSVSAVYLGANSQAISECQNCGNGKDKIAEYHCFEEGCGYYCVTTCDYGSVRDAYGICYSCNSGDIYMGSSYDSEQQCDHNCGDYGMFYEYKNGGYYCTSSCPYGYIRSSGSCMSCDVSYDIYMGETYDSEQQCDFNCGGFGKSYQYKDGAYYCAATPSS